MNNKESRILSKIFKENKKETIIFKNKYQVLTYKKVCNLTKVSLYNIDIKKV